MTDVLHVEPGEWYYGVLCRRCQAPILVALDLSAGVKKYPGNEPKLLLRCQSEECGSVSEYRAREIENMRAPYRS